MEDLKFPMYLPFEDRTYSVLGYMGEVEEYKDNKGYINRENDKVYIYYIKKLRHDDVPSFQVIDGKIKIKDVLSPHVNEGFLAKNLYSLSLNVIMEETKGDEVLYNEEALADMNAATSVFIPTINEEDDALKRIIKQTIIDKKLDINRLKHKMPQKYGLTNMKSALVGKTKMSISNFNVWCELLGINYEVVITDDGTDPINPLLSPLHYYSKSNRIESGDSDEDDE